MHCLVMLLLLLLIAKHAMHSIGDCLLLLLVQWLVMVWRVVMVLMVWVLVITRVWIITHIALPRERAKMLAVLMFVAKNFNSLCFC